MANSVATKRAKKKTTTVPRAPKEPDLSTWKGRVAARLRELRLNKGWSADELRQRLIANGADESMNTSTVYKYENGERPIPVELVPVYADTFGIPCRSVLPRE